jgi:hypothetical protein
MNFPWKVRQINRNNALFGTMKYQVVVKDTAMFFKIRSWCLNRFGESIEYKYYRYLDKITLNPARWSWDTHTDQSWKGHIYLRDDLELQFLDNEYGSIQNAMPDMQP